MRRILGAVGAGDGDPHSHGPCDHHLHRSREHHLDADIVDDADDETTQTVAACTGSSLQLISEGTNGAAGTVVATFAIRNVSSSACHTYGWPGVLFLDKSGAP